MMGNVVTEEFISREAALEAFENADADVYEDYGDGTVDWGFGRKNIRDVINGIPAADVAPVVHEKWLLDRWPSWPHRECSRCKIMFPRTTEVTDQYWQYCPNCGARMDGAAE